MSAWHGWRTRVRRAWHRRRFEAEMVEEMRAHVDLEAAAHRARGEDEAAARRRAALDFGHVASLQEDVRDRRLGRSIDEAVQDLRYACRLLRKAPGFTFVVVATLAVGIGANVAIFSTLDAVLLRPLPYPDADRLVQVREVQPSGMPNSVAGGVFRDWRDHNTQFDSVALVGPVRLNLRASAEGGGTPDRLDGLEVSHELLRVLGIQPLLGRGFLPADEQFGGDTHVVVLTEELWRSRFGADPSIVGRSITLDEVPRTVIGVAPRGTWLFRDVQFFVPAVLDPKTFRSQRAGHWAEVYGRLKPGATVERADVELNGIKRRLVDAYPAFKRSWSVSVRALQAQLAGDPRPMVLMLAGAVALVLLIACANVANLLLARACHRQQEIAVRAALGARARRIVRQVLTESLLLAAIGGAAGILLAYWGVGLLVNLTADLLPRAMAPQLDRRVLAFAVVVTGATGVLFGLLPAWRLRRPDLIDALRDGGRTATGGGRGRTQSTLVVVQVALTVVLLATAGLLARSLIKAAHVDPGFEPRGVLAFELSLPAITYESADRRLAFSRDLLARIRALPGVESVGTSMAIPFSAGGYGEYVSRSDRPQKEEDLALGRLDYVSDGYLETLRTRLLAGRYFTAADNRRDARPVAIVSETTARLLFPNESPIGRRLDTITEWEIVGVIANVVDRRLDLTHRPFVYVPQAFNSSRFAVAVRTTGDPLRAMGAIRDVVRRIDPGLSLVNIRTLDRAMGESMQDRRGALVLVAGFAAAALTLACMGLYGVMAYAVATRRRELCIRLALGAARADVIRPILRDGLVLMLAGVVIGLAAAVGTGRVMQGLLYQVRAYEPAVIAVTVLVMIGVALIACWIPARRATRLNAVAALRNP